MPINISPVGGNIPTPQLTKPSAPNQQQGESFQKLLGDAAGTLTKIQAEADSSTAKLLAGEQVEIHDVLLATEKANLAFQFAVQVKNKVVEAYQEVMRMQV